MDDGVAILFVYKKIKDKITPEINAKVEDILNHWFGVEYELIEGYYNNSFLSDWHNLSMLLQ